MTTHIDQQASRLCRDLAQEIGTDNLISDPDRRASYESDWTGRYQGSAACVARPADTGEVARIVEICAAHGAAVVAQGGNTGLVGGGVPRAGAVVCSLARLQEIGDLDCASRQITVGAGTRLEALQQRLSGSGLSFAVDHGARSAATIGGMVATNAGGIHALRYGPMRQQIAGLEAVMADGSVVSRMTGLLKDNAGYDLPSLFVGSEGTLCIVCRARLRLVHHLTERATALFALEGTAAALELLRRLGESVPSVEAAELFYQDGLELVCDYRNLSAPFSHQHGAYVLVECAASYDPTDELAAVSDGPGVSDVAVAVDAARREQLWSYREHHTEAINATAVPHKLDVAVPLDRLEDFERKVRERIAAAAPQATPILFGHIGDGNIHVNVIGADPGDEALDQAVLELVAECGGSISAEHGIGHAKRKWLGLTRSEAEIAVMTQIKRSLDPAGLLNPGVLFDL